MDKSLKRLENKLEAVHRIVRETKERIERIERTMGMEAAEFVEKNVAPRKRTKRAVDDEAEEVNGTESEIERMDRAEAEAATDVATGANESESEDDLVVEPMRVMQDRAKMLVVFTTEDGDVKSMEACEFAKKHRDTMNKFKTLAGMSYLREYLSSPTDFDFDIRVPNAPGYKCAYHGFSHPVEWFDEHQSDCRVWLGKKMI